MNNVHFNDILGLKLKEVQKCTRPIVIYGAAGYASEVLRFLNECNVKPIAICDSDSNKIGKSFSGFIVMSFKEVLEKYNDFDVLIASERFYGEIKDYVLKFIPQTRICEIDFLTASFEKVILNNIDKLEKIYENLADLNSKETMVNVIKGKITNDLSYFEKIQSKDEYFNDITNPSDNEYLIDGGAYIGDTIQQFISRVKDYRKIYCFEPSEKIFNQLTITKKKVCNDDKRIVLYKKGLYSCNKRISFNNQIGNGGDKIDETMDNDNKVEVVSIDEIIDDKVTFIKMDIEGSELEALRGAKKTILKYRPKLAICVYHKNDDLIKIPQFIMDLGLDYKYYLRHHGDFPAMTNGTVFYAV
ncbi:MAG: FkbM family methyltransferase [Bacillota bacterium]